MPPDGLNRLRNARILVVEDSVANQTLARDLLLHVGAHVSLAGNGREAIAAIRDAAEPYDAVLMDLQMPVMDGLEAIGVIRAELAQSMPIIATSAHSNKSEEERCLAAGANDCLPKPFHINDLYAVLIRWLKPAGGADEVLPAVPEADEVWLPDGLEGVDLAVGLAGLGQNRALYAQLLAEFAKTNAGLLGELDEAANRDDRDRIRFLVHAIRSTAGSIGAAPLSQAAASVEEAVIEGTGDLDALLEDFRSRMGRVIGAIVAAGLDRIKRRPVRGTSPVAFDKDRAKELYGRLLDLLDDQDMSAQRYFEELAAMLGGGAQGGTLAELAESMDALDYSNARQILERVERDLLQ